MLASKPGLNHRLSRYERLFVITTLAEPMAGYVMTQQVRRIEGGQSN